MTAEVVLDALRGLGLGLVVGCVFGAAGMPAPAPPTTEGVLGVVGLSLGWYVARKLA